MASFYRKRGKEVVVFTSTSGKREALPRALTRHLDGEPDSNIEFWLREYELMNGLRTPIHTTVDIDKYIEQWANYLKSSEVLLKAETIEEHTRHLRQSVVPYFLGLDPPLTDPNDWGFASVRLSSHLKSIGRTDGQIRRATISLRKLYKWMAEERIILGNGALMVRLPKYVPSKTPLERIITPDEILIMAQKESNPDLSLMLLCGYFLSMRPQEVFGAKPSDFKAGSGVVGNLECIKAFRSIGLYDKLAFNVVRQRTTKNQIRPPKLDSYGWVGCFNEAAALAIVNLLRGFGANEYLVKVNLNKLYKEWKKTYDFKPKDLRRSSLYWLGHYTAITVLQLMKQSRHKSIESVLCYLRRPDETVDGGSELDLSA